MNLEGRVPAPDSSLTQAECAAFELVTDIIATFPVTAYAKAGQAEPPGWTKPATSVDAVFSPSTIDLGQGSLGQLNSADTVRQLLQPSNLI